MSEGEGRSGSRSGLTDSPQGAGEIPRDEAEALRRRVAELERDLAEAARRQREAELKLLAHEAILEATPAIVFLKDRSHRYLYVNQAYADRFGIQREALIGKVDAEFFPPEVAEAYRESDEVVMATGVAREGVELRGERADGSEIWTLESDVPYRDERGEILGMAGVALDVTERKRAELALREREAALERLVEQKDRLLATVLELAAPILPVAEGVLVLPLVGHIDEARAERILEVLLSGVERHRASQVILDLTGVPTVDAAVAERLSRAARATCLLGAEVALTGASPEIARKLVEIGADLGALRFARDLRSAIRQALGRQASRGQRPPR